MFWKLNTLTVEHWIRYWQFPTNKFISCRRLNFLKFLNIYLCPKRSIIYRLRRERFGGGGGNKWFSGGEGGDQSSLTEYRGGTTGNWRSVRGSLEYFSPWGEGGGRDGKFYCDSITSLNPEKKKKKFPLFGKARIRMKGKMNMTKNWLRTREYWPKSLQITFIPNIIRLVVSVLRYI